MFHSRPVNGWGPCERSKCRRIQRRVAYGRTPLQSGLSDLKLTFRKEWVKTNEMDIMNHRNYAYGPAILALIISAPPGLGWAGEVSYLETFEVYPYSWLSTGSIKKSSRPSSGNASRSPIIP